MLTPELEEKIRAQEAAGYLVFKEKSEGIL